MQWLKMTITGSVFSAKNVNLSVPSHVLKAIRLTGEEANSTIRFSLGSKTTSSDTKN